MNVAAIVIQAFVVSRIVKRFGHRGRASWPCPSSPSASTAWRPRAPASLALRVLKTAENAADYSVMNTAKQMLWLPTSREEKYKAKQAIDTFFVRCGDLLAALVVFLGTHVVTSAVPGFARVNIVVVLASVGVALLLLREYRRLAGATEGGKAA